MRASLPARTLGLLMALTLAVTLWVPVAYADDIRNTQGFRKAVTLSGIREHQAAFQAHGNANGGTRVAGSPGYEASANYVVSRMQAAGYLVSSQYFEFPYVGDRTPPTFQQISPSPRTFVDGVDYGTMQYSGSGDVTAPLVAVDLVLPPPPGPGNNNTSGCEAADFAGFPAGAIALMQRGTCTFRIKAENALAAGAVAVVIFNEGQVGRTTGLFGTLGAPPFSMPVLSASFQVGDSLRNGVLNGPTGVTVRVRADIAVETRPTRNIIAETTGGDPNNVIVIGAHLDSVSRGPGINDNGSGSATILEIAEVFAAQGRTTRNKLRFIWWGAEEQGLLGSNYYVSQLSAAERDRIALNLNFDMVGSPNYVRFVYDGDNSAFPVGPGAAEGPDGSGSIEAIFHQYFDSQNLASAETPFSGRSDYGPFIAVGIPAGGLFTGAEGIKTAEQAASFGGTAGEPYDPCYHLACDTYANNSDAGLDEMSDAAAHAVLYFSKRNFAKEPLTDLVTAQGDGANGSSSGLHADHDHALETK
jgi:Zn-dependent M28 family amino/carboxypeptidase